MDCGNTTRPSTFSPNANAFVKDAQVGECHGRGLLIRYNRSRLKNIEPIGTAEDQFAPAGLMSCVLIECRSLAARPIHRSGDFAVYTCFLLHRTAV